MGDMNIRKYTIIVLVLLVLGSLGAIIGYQYFYSRNTMEDMDLLDDNYRLSRAEGDKIEVYSDGDWEDFDIRGLEISSFMPGHARYKTKIDKKLVIQWLEEIARMNGNLIKITGIQAPSFYNAIYDYNQKAEEPIYTIHEIKLDENTMMNKYDAYDKKLMSNFKKDIRNTINIIHGRAFMLRGKRNYSGLYLKDISNYNLGFILGSNSIPELVSLTDRRHGDINSYEGSYINLEEGSAFEAFMAEMMDYATSYEAEKYKQISLLSYETAIELDPIEYKYESKLTRDAKIDMNKIDSNDLNNLFVAYRFYPSSVDFLDYEYYEEDEELGEDQETKVYQQLERLEDLYDKPLVISDTGISSSRAISRLDVRDGFNRGGFTEKEQGEKLLELLEIIDRLDIAGTIINSWQDDWTSTRSSSGIIDLEDKNQSSSWYNPQISDESFGLVTFELDEKYKKIYIDGDIDEWEDTDYLIEGDVSLKVRTEPSYLYLLLEKEDWDLERDEIYLGIDITDKSGSKVYSDAGARFSLAVDFIVQLNGYETSRLLVHERYNIFDYLYKYYSPMIDKQEEAPDLGGDSFGPIYNLTRRKFYYPNEERLVQASYEETGRLVHGNANPSYSDFNSLADFMLEGDHLEMRIPWELINVKNPKSIYIYDDFYSTGLEESVTRNSIGFSIYDGLKDELIEEEGIHKIDKRQDRSKYRHRMKKSYFMLRDYWGGVK